MTQAKHEDSIPKEPSELEGKSTGRPYLTLLVAFVATLAGIMLIYGISPKSGSGVDPSQEWAVSALVLALGLVTVGMFVLLTYWCRWTEWKPPPRFWLRLILFVCATVAMVLGSYFCNASGLLGLVVGLAITVFGLLRPYAADAESRTVAGMTAGVALGASVLLFGGYYSERTKLQGDYSDEQTGVNESLGVLAPIFDAGLAALAVFVFELIWLLTSSIAADRAPETEEIRQGTASRD